MRYQTDTRGELVVPYRCRFVCAWSFDEEEEGKLRIDASLPAEKFRENESTAEETGELTPLGAGDLVEVGTTRLPKTWSRPLRARGFAGIAKPSTTRTTRRSP
jgi:hypothetical protein